MSDYAPDESSQQPLSGEANFQNSLDDSANNSIIGKVKSRVSSILPNRLSKWFSPSSKPQNESINGSLCGENPTVPSRRRRRIEVEEEESYEDDNFQAEFKASCLHLPTKQDHDVDVDDENENDEDDDSQNSDYEYSSHSAKLTRREIKVERQPPAKKSRLNVEVHESPYITRHQPLLASTPDVGLSNLRSSSTSSPALRYNYQRYTHLNLYGNQNKKEPAFDFGQQKNDKSVSKPNTDIIDLITNTSYEHENLAEASNSCRSRNSGISSRRSLNIQSSSSKIYGNESSNTSAVNLKRQPLSSGKTDVVDVVKDVYVPPRRTSTTIQEVDPEVGEHHEKKRFTNIEKRDLTSVQNSSTYNGCAEIPQSFTNKRQKIINGTSLSSAVIPKTNEIISVDSASESGESAIDKTDASQAQHRRTGLFNMSANASTRNNSRTPSFGNGLNFYSHLEGQKSLFSGSYHGNSHPINNSTLSLTSLNRRQFNASIYGSTSALSDSRLLNTFSPFYKGKTTYGGAAAYNKYTAGTGASAVRITPTLIRPTSSLSNLSSSNSFTNNVNSHVVENSSISSTAKRILDLINDFATPLSDAKKMATNLKANSVSHIPPQAKSRLNENDLNESRSIRLSQVRTPYSKPNVILLPSGNASGVRGEASGVLPPIKELQVPTMSQLLQMKKMQNTTEKARKIAKNSDLNTEYTLPDIESYKTNSTEDSEKDKQKHTNKVRSKITKSLRTTTMGKDILDEEPPPPVNLPNIAFPVMQSVPKIDIQLNKTFEQSKTTSKVEPSTIQTLKENLGNDEKDTPKSATFPFNIPQKKSLGENVSTTEYKNQQFTSIASNSSVKTFKFSEPLQVNGEALYCQNITQNEKEKYKFSPPLDVDSNSLNLNKKPLKLQLKEGSCIDVLKSTIILPSSTSKSGLDKKTDISYQSLTSSFGNEFKKALNEWECDVCLVRNKSDSKKCIACETPNKNAPLSNQSSSKSILPVAPSFGQQFKKSSKEWECETCMIRNKEETEKCIACETPRKSVPVGGNTIPLIKNSFGDAFKPASGTWECQTCMISNKSEANECIACQTKKPGSTNTSQCASSIPQFKFGLNNANKPSNNADDVFKTLAAQQKSSKWECDACMTRNDANRTKCACCEQPKPGTSNADSTAISSNKFEFGATAASKFSFGFGTGPNASKEEDIRKELLKKSEEPTKPPMTNSVTSKTDSSNFVGFKFGITPSTDRSSEPNNDSTDGKKQAQGFQFGVSTPTTESKVNDKLTDVSTTVDLGCNAKILTSDSPSSCKVTSSAASGNTTTVKFSLPTTISTTNVDSKDNEKKLALPVFGFGSSSATSTSGGFSFDSKTAINSNAGEKDKSALESTAFKTPTMKSSGFSFGSTSTNAVSSTPPVCSSLNTTSTITTATTTSSTLSTASDTKPLFSFGTNTSSTTSSTVNSTPVLSNFVFGGSSTNNAAATTTASSLFGAVTSTSAVTNTTNTTSSKTALSTLTTTTAPPVSTTTTNIFGSFSAVGSSNAFTSQIFRSSINTPANNNSSTVSSSTNNPATLITTPQFGSFGSKPASNVPGTFGGIGNAGTKNTPWENKNETKSTLPTFGNVASSTPSQSNAPGFVFGSKSVVNTTAETSISTTSPVTSTSITWPKSSFVFGSNAPSSTIITAQTNDNENKDVTKPSVFSAFGSSSTNPNNQQLTSSIFGMQKPNTGSSFSSSETPSAGATGFSTNLFNTNSAPAATNIFGTSSSVNAATPAPAFGSSPFGGAASSTSATPTFGSTAASGTTFGSFGNSTSNTTTNTTEVKKPEAAFSFGAAPTAQSTSGGFNFGLPAATSKPAFNFGSASNNQQPTFNFTGSTEGTANAPFQFNAGAAPVSSNIFAPTPTVGAQTAQQAKRKIRAPIRRVTQR